MENKSGLSYSVARTLSDVLEAWQLVYRSYRRAGLIQSHRWKLHTVPHAVQNQSVVVRGRIRAETVSTLSAYLDTSNGLPLDSVYPDELATLRRNGRRLVEFGLFADRRHEMQRTVAALLELMRWACHFGVHSGATDGIIGVHPRHAAFYERLLAFERIGEVRLHPTVNEAEVVLLRLDWYAQIVKPRVPRGLRYWMEKPLPATAFLERSMFTPEELASSPLADYLGEMIAAPIGADA
ncbi:MAG: hypothetical protein WD294_14045 [Phycisphaeraceae bacterium]